MSSEKFIKNNTALITLIAACLVVLISLGVRQVFGMFFLDFNKDLGITNTQFGLAIGIQMLGWGLTGPIFGAIADKYGGHKAITLAFIFYIAGIYFLYAGPNTGIFFQINLGLFIGIGLGGTAISIPMSIVGKHFPLSNRNYSHEYSYFCWFIWIFCITIIHNLFTTEQWVGRNIIYFYDFFNNWFCNCFFC